MQYAQRGNRVDNNSGVKGIISRKRLGHKDKWRAMIAEGGRLHHLGQFSDFTESVAHRLVAEQCLGWEGCDSCSPAYQYMEGITK